MSKCALTFWTAAFPGLARDLPEVRESAKAAGDNQKSYVIPSCPSYLAHWWLQP